MNVMQWDIEKLSSPLSSGAGQNLRYEPIYDKIKEARFEEDSSLSRGVWARELKKADWPQVYTLCTESLENSTKDLQIMGWLCEAACHIEQWAGLQKSFELAHNFCQNCWDCFYPEEGTDVEYRIRVFDWFIEKMAECSLFMPIAKPNGLIAQPLDLSMWLNAQNFDLVSRRSGATAAKVQEAENAGQMTLKRFRTLMKQASIRDVEQVFALVHEVSGIAINFSDFLQKMYHSQSPSFKRFNEQLRSVEEICKFSLEGREHNVLQPPAPALPNIFVDSIISVDEGDGVPSSVNEAELRYDTEVVVDVVAAKAESPSDEVTIATRLDAYKAVGDLADYLIEVDSQSPGPYLIKMISSWGDKPLPEVWDDITTGTTAGHKVLKMLSEVIRRG
jgi:type VI secretion system protein ImpA